MRRFSILPLLAFSLFLRGAAPLEPGEGELFYRATVRFRDSQSPVITHFTLIPTPVAETHNKVKKLRMGSWRLEGIQKRDDTIPQAAILARVERLLYFSGPTPNLVQKPIYIRYDDKKCQVWQVPVPSGLHAYAYLVGIHPDLLALAYFSGSFDSGELASVELQLEHFQLLPGAAPAEDGTVLLTTLQRLAKPADGTVLPTETVE